MVIVDLRLGTIAFIVLPPALILTRWFQRRSAVAQLEVRERIAAVTAVMAESVSGMAIVQAFNRERAFQAEFDTLNVANRTANVRTQTLLSVFFPSIELLASAVDHLARDGVDVLQLDAIAGFPVEPVEAHLLAGRSRGVDGD